jgi:hypothetical protein
VAWISWKMDIHNFAEVSARIGDFTRLSCTLRRNKTNCFNNPENLLSKVINR